MRGTGSGVVRLPGGSTQREGEGGYRKKNCCHASHHVVAVDVIVRSAVSATPGFRVYSSSEAVRVNSTSIVHGLPGSYGATALRSESAAFAPASISSRARWAGS